MRTTRALDESLIVDAQRLNGIPGKSALVREALRALIERESARGLVSLGEHALGCDRVHRRRRLG
ncbi:MAG: type II toxin-antitoxin system VapB family antitoxin [Ferrimicrobium sp.]